MATRKKDDWAATNRYTRILTNQNIRVSSTHIALLRKLTKEMRLSVAGGDLSLLDGKWYVSALPRFWKERLSDPAARRWIFKAIVFTNPRCKGFTGYGDAEPSNVSSQVQGAEMRVAETRAVNRALRKAYGVGICSVEELGAATATSQQPDPHRWVSADHKRSDNRQPRLRDQLCVLIRQHNLNPNLVKAYAADFCGTATLGGASRELVESFISHLSTAAIENRDGLVCKLNSYAPSVEAQP